MIAFITANSPLGGYAGQIKAFVFFIVVVVLVYWFINIPDIPIPPTVRRFLNLALEIIALLVILLNFLLPLLGI